MQVIFTIPKTHRPVDRQAFLSTAKRLGLDISVKTDCVIAKTEKEILLCRCYGLVEQKKRMSLNDIMNSGINRYIAVDNAIKVNITKSKNYIIWFKTEETGANNNYFKSGNEHDTRLLYAVNKLILNIKG